MLRLWLALGIGIAALVASGVVASMATAQAGVDPAAVITSFETARNRRDVDTALSYFADDATISQRNTTYSGKDEIRRFLEGTSTRPRQVVVSDRRASGNSVTWTERAGGPPPGQPAQGLAGGLANANAFQISVEATVQDGKIHSLSYQVGGSGARADPALDGRAQLPASVGLGAVLAIMLAVLMLASTGMRRSTGGASSLRGRLLHDLQGWSAAR